MKRYVLMVLNYPDPFKDGPQICASGIYTDLNEAFRCKHHMEMGHSRHGYRYAIEEYDGTQKMTQ